MHTASAMRFVIRRDDGGGAVSQALEVTPGAPLSPFFSGAETDTVGGTEGRIRLLSPVLPSEELDAVGPFTIDSVTRRGSRGKTTRFVRENTARSGVLGKCARWKRGHYGVRVQLQSHTD